MSAPKLIIEPLDGKPDLPSPYVGFWETRRLDHPHSMILFRLDVFQVSNGHLCYLGSWDGSGKDDLLERWCGWFSCLKETKPLY